MESSMIQLDSSTLQFLWIGIAFYVFAMLLVGFVCGRKIQNMSDFILAGRRLPMWMATATLIATWFGAASCLGVAATVYSGSIRDVIADPFAASICLVLAGLFIVGALRKQRCMTVTDIIQQKYGKTAGIYVSLWMLPVYIGWVGSLVVGLGGLLNLLTGVNLFWAQMLGAAIVLVYTVTGGMWAVTLTDIIQITMIIVGLVLLLPGTVSAAGGINAIFQNADLSLLPPDPGALNFSGWINYAGNWMIMGLGCMVGQDLIQRSLASKNEKTAVYSSIISGFLYFAIAAIPIVIGLSAKILLRKWEITDDMMNLDLENQVLTRVAIGVLGGAHPIMLSLFLAALISAIMSSADSSLLAAASLFSNNILLPLFPKISERKMLNITRLATVLILVFATMLALKVRSIYVLMINCWASQLVILFLPVISAIYLKKVTRRTIWLTMGIATVVWIGYLLVAGFREGGGYMAVMGSEGFAYALTNGSVYGFLAGAMALGIGCILDYRRTAVSGKQ